jgi:adenosylmethionine-8-amino-7-oxononanoate aminotransferase
MYDPLYLRRAREICDRHGVHLIADEIAVGMGRTGTMFACEQAAITPDFLLLGKGLTGGYLPLSAVLTTQSVYEAFYDDYETRRAFLHSHSYAGNALGCRAALATLDIFLDEPVLKRNRELGACMEAACAPLREHPHVSDVRRTGMIVAIEMVRDRATNSPFDWRERRGHRVSRYGLEHEIFLRPLGDVIYFMPPYVINEAEINLLVRVVVAGIDLATM